MACLQPQISALPWCVLVPYNSNLRTSRTQWCKDNIGFAFGKELGGYQWRGPIVNWYDLDTDITYWNREAWFFRDKDAAVMFDIV